MAVRQRMLLRFAGLVVRFSAVSFCVALCRISDRNYFADPFHGLMTGERNYRIWIALTILSGADICSFCSSIPLFERSPKGETD